MKINGLLAGIGILTGVMTVAKAGDDSITLSGKPLSGSKSNAVAQLRSSDNAFSLMIESYRQIQSLMIESDFNKQIAATDAVKDPKEHDRLVNLITQDHDARLEKLKTMVSGFNSAYGDTRKPAERKIGTEVPSTATPEIAQEELRHFVPYSPEEFRLQKGGSDLLPAGAHMIYDDKQQ